MCSIKMMLLKTLPKFPERRLSQSLYFNKVTALHYKEYEESYIGVFLFIFQSFEEDFLSIKPTNEYFCGSKSFR